MRPRPVVLAAALLTALASACATPRARPALVAHAPAAPVCCAFTEDGAELRCATVIVRANAVRCPIAAPRLLQGAARSPAPAAGGTH